MEAVSEAARRAGIRLQWIETGTSSDEAFQKGLVDLWPLMANTPERRKTVYLSQPWVLGRHVLLTLSGSPTPTRDFSGRVGVFKLPLHVRMVQQTFPHAQVIRYQSGRDVLQQVCLSNSAGFLENRVAMMALHDMPPECTGVPLRIYNLPNIEVKTSVASTFAAAGAADLLRKEIGRMYRDGSLAITMAKYSFYGLDEAWATFDMIEATERWRWIAWGSAGLAIALCIAFYQTLSLRQRKRSEAVLRESEERFRAIFQQAGVGVAQIGLDGRVELANDRYCSVIGRKRDRLVGRGTKEMTLSEDLKEQIAMMPKLLSGEIDSFSTEKRYEREDGSIVWAEVCKSLVRNSDGTPMHFIAVVQDITERKKAEAALKESEERFRNMADSAPVLIWVSGPDKLCTFFNKTWIEFTGRSMEQNMGDGWAESVHPEDLDRCIATYVTSFDQRRDFQMEYRLRRADDEYRCVLDHGVARFSRDGEFAGYIGSCIDITDLKSNYDRHLASQKLESLGVLAAGVAHDFNNLLGAIIARTECAKTDLPVNSEAADDVDQIRLTALRAAEIVSQMMTFAGQETAPSAAIDLSNLVSETLALLRVSIAKTAVLKTELAADLPRVLANPAEIRQVVMNLIINASEALGGEAGCISITTARVYDYPSVGDGVRLHVSDTGCGMTEELKKRIFDPFFTTRFAGRGLGLSAVQGIVRRHGGTISVESAPGSGSEFTVVLPCAAVQSGSPSEPPRPSQLSAEPSGAVLFIEDEDALRTVVAKMLRRNQFEVIEAADGRLAVEILQSNPEAIGLVLLDVSLPGKSGAELFDELHRIRPDLRVILSTAYSRETAMAGFQGRPIWDFIRKPYRVEEVLQVLARAANGVNPK